MNDERFKYDESLGISNEKTVFKGDNYRITVLTERLLRLEYSDGGLFYDGLTETVLNRKFPTPDFKVNEDNKYLEITTKYFKLQYRKGMPFVGPKFAPDANLKVALVNTDKTWYFNHPEARNFKGKTLGFDEYGTKVKMENGLYSTDGFASIDDSKTMIFDSEGYMYQIASTRIDTYVFMYRRDFGLCLKDYYLLTGRPPLIPRYALGIWWHRDKTYSFDDTKKLVNLFNKNNIPISVLLLGHKWNTKPIIDGKEYLDYKTGYTFNKKLFENPSAFTKYMHDRGIRVGLNMNPVGGINVYEESYTKIAGDLGIQNGKPIPFNIYDKNIVNEYFQNIVAPLTRLGVDFYWLEYTNDLNSLKALTNYHFNYYKANQNQRGMVMSKSNGKALHRYPIHYSGETTVSWDTLKILPFYNSQASNVGVSWWSHDVGGYKDGIEDNELYARYVQLATYSPIFRFSSKYGHYYKREPWKWDSNTLNIVREYCLLRHRLIPYLYSGAYRYYKNGLPLVQPLYYEAPETYDEPEYKNEYYFGSELFVSPITAPKDTVMNRAVQRVYLPKGTWYEFKTGKKFAGDKRYVTFYNDEDYPVYAKEGSIIPLAILDKNINVTNPPESMEIHVFPGKSNIFKLYEDDGYSSLYEDGYYLITAIDYNYLANNYTLIIRPLEGKSGIIPSRRNYKVRFRNTREAEDVVVYIDKEPIECLSYVEDNDFIVEVDNVKTISQVTINCKGKDIEIEALRAINEDIDSIISDLEIDTNLKEVIAKIIFDENLDIKKKRIAIRKLKSSGLKPIFIRMFIKLLEYASEV